MTIFPYTADDIDIRDIDRAYDNRDHGKLAQWCRELLHFREGIATRERKVAALQTVIDDLEDRMCELTERLNAAETQTSEGA